MKVDKYIQLNHQYYLSNKGSYLILEYRNQEVNDIAMALSIYEGIIFCLADGSRTIKDIDNFLCTLYKNYTKSCAYIYKKYIHFFDESNSPFFVLRKGDCAVLLSYIRNYGKKRLIDPYLSRSLDHLMIYVTTKCHFDCSYCFLEHDMKNGEDDLPIATLKRIANEAKCANIKTIELCGGDPLDRPDIIEVIKAFSDQGLYVRLSTKHSFSDSFAIQVAGTGIGEIGISLDTISETIAKKLIANPSYSIKDVLTSIDALIKVGVPTKIKTVITSLNIFDIPRMINELYHLGCRCFELNPFFSLDSSHELEYLHAAQRDYVILENDISVLEKRFPDIKIERNFSLSDTKKTEGCSTYCSARFSSLIIHANGQYGFCANSLDLRLRFGNVDSMSLYDAWNSQEFHRFLFPKQELFSDLKCGQCAEYYDCLPKRCLVRSIRSDGQVFGKDFICGVDI